MKNCDHSICPGWSVLLLNVPAHKGCLFKRFIFELDPSTYSLRITCILCRQVEAFKTMVEAFKTILSKISYFNLMVSYLYSLNPFISINEIGKYLSRYNV